MKENKDFMEEWTKTGMMNWKANREIRAQRIQKQLYFDDREVQIYKDRLTREFEFNTNDMITGIDEFQENLRKLGIEENIPIQEAIKKQEEKRGIPPGQIQNFSYAATMNKIKETKSNNEFAGKERERRNRKMKVDQKIIQETLDKQKKEELLIQKLMKNQSQEQAMAYLNQRKQHCKQVVFNNRIVKAQEF